MARRSLAGERLEMLCVDGLRGRSGVGAPLPPTVQWGLLAALPTAFPDILVQRCWAHKIRNVLNKVRKPD